MLLNFILRLWRYFQTLQNSVPNGISFSHENYRFFNIYIYITSEINSIFIITTNDKDLRPEFSRVLVHLTQTPDLIHTSLIRDTLAYEHKRYC